MKTPRHLFGCAQFPDKLLPALLPLEHDILHRPAPDEPLQQQYCQVLDLVLRRVRNPIER